MKKLITLLAAMAIALCASAQTKTAYLDLYQRGGARHLRTTLMFDGKPVYIGVKNLGEVLNELSGLGWEVDKTFNVKRSPDYNIFTRHKFHVILKKEYTAGENPFEGLSSSVPSTMESQKTIFIPEDITSVAKWGYYKRTDLNEIHLHKNVINIEAAAFAKCSNLKSIYCRSLTPPKVGFNALLAIPQSAKIYVPRASEKAYKKAKGWKKYASQIIGYDF